MRRSVAEQRNHRFIDLGLRGRHGMAERLLEAVSRGMWPQPDPETVDGLKRVLLETEGELES